MTTPSSTIYLKNLPDRLTKSELKSQLYALFLPYGVILDIVALKTQKMRGQAFVVFEDLAAATTAMRAWEGEMFYDKPMRIEYAKTKSWATLKSEDPNFVPGIGKTNIPAPPKRSREGEVAGDPRASKKERRDEDEEEMEMDDD